MYGARPRGPRPSEAGGACSVPDGGVMRSATVRGARFSGCVGPGLWQHTDPEAHSRCYGGEPVTGPRPGELSGGGCELWRPFIGRLSVPVKAPLGGPPAV